MDWLLLLILLLSILFALLVPGLWIAIALGATGMIGLMIAGRYNLFDTLAVINWSTGSDFILTAIPLFLFMGEVILVSGLSKRFYASIAKWLKPVPGGLLHSNIISSGLFSAISGSSVATAAAIGSVAIPEMKKYGYKREHIYGSIAAGGTLGILIPPSIVLILYGVIVDESITKLFMAAVLPGILLTMLFLLYTIGIMLRKKNRIVSGEIEEISIMESLKGVLPLFILILIVLGSLYSGKITPTESAGLGVFITIIIGFVFGNLSFKKIFEAAKNSIKTTSMLIFIMIGAQIFSFAVVTLGINREITSWLTSMELSPLLLLMIVCLIYIVLGFFMDGPAMMFLTLPLLFPVIEHAGFDPIWFGIVLVILVELGQITPPMGLNIFVIKSIDSTSKINEIVRGVLPYCIIMLLAVVLLTIFPQIALWLPGVSN